MEDDDLPPRAGEAMPSRPARPALNRRNAQNQVPLTVEAQATRAGGAGGAQLHHPDANSDEAREVAQASSSGLAAMDASIEHESLTLDSMHAHHHRFCCVLQAPEATQADQARAVGQATQALQDAEVDEETLIAEQNALTAVQKQYLQRYQESRAAEAAQAPEVSQTSESDIAAVIARIRLEQAAVDSLPSHVRRTRSEELAWTHRHLARGYLSQCHRDVPPGPQALDPESTVADIDNARVNWAAQDAQASFASSSSSTMRSDTPRPTFAQIYWSVHNRQELNGLNPSAAPFTPRAQLAVNLPASIQEKEEELGQGYEIINIENPSAENGKGEFGVDSLENTTIAESSTSAATANATESSYDHSWFEKMVDQIVRDDEDDDDDTAIASHPTS
ncbi:hypothetical protein EAF04_004748 [Stromatinia cepivora]|nr:hypothetical protein EAF04_004748 [Stromatinia cepivora]